jgi:hypothetical protein
MVLMVGKETVEWYTRDIRLPIRWEKNIRIRPKGTATTQ